MLKILYQPKKRTFDPLGKSTRSFKKIRVVGAEPLLIFCGFCFCDVHKMIFYFFLIGRSVMY